jgi:hypothetical protein
METIKGIGLSCWASYLINGDDSGIDDQDKAHADAFAEWLGGGIVECKDAGFCWTHNGTQFGALAGDCQEYTALIDAGESTGPVTCAARGWHRASSSYALACSDCGSDISEDDTTQGED